MEATMSQQLSITNLQAELDELAEMHPVVEENTSSIILYAKIVSLNKFLSKATKCQMYNNPSYIMAEMQKIHDLCWWYIAHIKILIE